MAIICEKREKVLNFMEEKPTVYIIAPTKPQQVTFEKLLDEISSSCGVGRAQVKASVEGMMDRMALFMEYGMSVKLGDFGTFKPTVNVKSQKSADDLGADNVVRRKILFRPGKRFKTMLSTLSVTTVSDPVLEGKTSGNGNNNGEGTGNGDDNWQDPDA